MKKLSKKEILENAEKRKKEMEFDLAFYENVMAKMPTSRILKKIELLRQDIKELENELEIFKKL